MNIVAFKTCEADKVSEVPDSAFARQVQGDSKDWLTEQGIARNERGQRRKAARAKLCEDEEQLKQQWKVIKIIRIADQNVLDNI